MKLVDLNILIYAINRACPQHTVIKQWWEEVLNGLDPIGLCWPVISGFLRITTNPRIFPRPLTVQTALEQIDQWLELPSVRIVGEPENHWLIMRSLLAKSGCAGNLTTDSHLASLAIGHGAILVSCDRDFARFSGLRWENPLES